MAEKRKVGGVVLDDFHYHEAVHTLNVAMSLIDSEILQHPVLKLEKDACGEIDTAMEHLMLAYQNLSAKY